MLNRLLVFQPVLDELFSDLGGLNGVTKMQQVKLKKNHLCISDWDIYENNYETSSTGFRTLPI